MTITSRHQYDQIKNAMYEEMNYLSQNNLELKDGSVGVGDHYYYASLGGYGNMGVYMTISECQNQLNLFNKRFHV